MAKQHVAEQETLGEAMNKTEFFFEKNGRMLSYVFLGLLVLAALVFGYRALIVSPRAEKAAEMIAEAQYRFEDQNADYALALEGDANGAGFLEVIEKYGSDAVRWYMISNSQPWDNLKFDVDGVEEVRRKFFGTLYNTYSFFALYANVDEFDYKEADVPMAERPEIDRWILSVLNTLVKNVDTCYNEYEPTKAGRLISEFVNDNLSNWYVRLNRKRFWGGPPAGATPRGSTGPPGQGCRYVRS